jgi:hypothetical protein
MPNVRIAFMFLLSHISPAKHHADTNLTVSHPAVGKSPMNDEPVLPATPVPERKPLSEAAKRALAEAAARRAQAPSNSAPSAKESGGPEGPEPTRFGDWERKGIASDF